MDKEEKPFEWAHMEEIGGGSRREGRLGAGSNLTSSTSLHCVYSSVVQR